MSLIGGEFGGLVRTVGVFLILIGLIYLSCTCCAWSELNPAISDNMHVNYGQKPQAQFQTAAAYIQPPAAYGQPRAAPVQATGQQYGIPMAAMPGRGEGATGIASAPPQFV